MTAYISISFNKRKSTSSELGVICDTLKEFKIAPFIFVDKYRFDAAQERQMMEQAISDIGQCDLLIAEVSDKAIGIGVEVGYAKAMAKPIVYIRRKSAEHSTTISGISDFHIFFIDTKDLQEQLAKVLQEILIILTGMKEYIFSYGTLQREKTQIELFGRVLQGSPDILRGFKNEIIEINDEAFLSKGEEKYQSMAINTKDRNDFIKGTVFGITKEELLLADKYEPVGYKRIQVVLESGKKAWIYVQSAGKH